MMQFWERFGHRHIGYRWAKVFRERQEARRDLEKLRSAWAAASYTGRVLFSTHA